MGSHIRAGNIRLKRAYERPAASDGPRLLVDRLWPRGVGKAAARIDRWIKEIAPTAGLRKWFGHDPEKWDEFRARYDRELDAHPEVWRPLLSASKRGRVTLVYSAHDTQHNNAVALLEYLRAKMSEPAAAERAQQQARGRARAAKLTAGERKPAKPAHRPRAARRP